MEQSYKEIADRHAEARGAQWAYVPQAEATWPLRSGLGAKVVTQLLYY